MTTQNTIMKDWIEARKTRKISSKFIFHSDRGVQYASNKTANICNYNLKITQSMSRKGNCWDNAVAESFFKIIKYEWLYRFKFTSYNQLFESIEDSIHWYNTERLHSSLASLSSRNENEIERNY
jgi:transposase InsO family protein